MPHFLQVPSGKKLPCLSFYVVSADQNKLMFSQQVFSNLSYLISPINPIFQTKMKISKWSLYKSNYNLIEF